jgi:outer membrane protein assembly factor BamA
VSEAQRRLSRKISGAIALSAAVCAASLAAAQTTDKPAKTNDESHTELGGLPLIGYDSDLGIAIGGFGSFARFDPDYVPYHYRIEVAGAITFKPSDDRLLLPYQDIYVMLTVPQLAARRLRLEVRASYTRETTLSYFGIGNAARAPEQGPEGQPAREYFHYGLMHPSLLVRARVKWTALWSVQFGNILSFERPDIREDSSVARDARNPSLERFFGTLAPHWVNVLETALLFDSRDGETSTLRGMYHQIKLRLSPGGIQPLPYRYGQLNLTLRFYETFDRLTLAARIVGDMLFGDAPFYELPRFEDTFALGGANGVRGVPAQRYSGKLKLFGNFEARVAITKFALFGLPCLLSAVGFFDGGRLWSDAHADPSLDGRSLGLKLGIGTGLRLQQGQAFVVRGDIAWSPDARPLGAYVIAGQTF